MILNYALCNRTKKQGYDEIIGLSYASLQNAYCSKKKKKSLLLKCESVPWLIRAHTLHLKKYCYVFTFLKALSSLIANKVIRNMCLISVKLCIVCTILCATVQTCTKYITITACSIFFSHNYSRFCSHRRSSYHNCFVYTKLYTRLTEFLLTVVCFVLPFYTPTQSV